MPGVLHMVSGIRMTNHLHRNGHTSERGIGLQNLPDALQNEVAFEVPVKVVHELKRSRSIEHQRKSATGAGGPFPFRDNAS